MILSAVRDIGCAFVLVQNDPELIAPLKALGIRTLYRQSGDGGIPDTPHDEALRDWVEHFVAERAAKGADYLQLFNEVESSPRLHLATRYALDYAIAHNLKLALYNYGTNAPRQSFEDARVNIQRAIEHAMLIGIHVYLEEGVQHRAGAFEWLAIKRELGGRWIATEFNFIRSIFDAEKGPRNYLGAAGRLTWAQFAERETPFFASEGIPLCWFSFDDWPDDQKKKENGFGYWNTPSFIQTLGQLNQTQPMKEVKPVTPTYPPGSDPAQRYVAVVEGLNLRTTPGGTLMPPALSFHEAVTVYAQPREPSGGHPWVRVTASDGRQGWSADDQGANGGTSFSDPTPPPANWTVSLATPYVSQQGLGADASPNDCGLASILMLQRSWMVARGLSVADLPAVNYLAAFTPLADPNPPKGLTFTQIGALSKRFGFPALYVQPLSEAQITSFLDMGRGVMVLLDYALYNPLSKPLAHILVVSGYSATHFLTQDPYLLGANVVTARSRLMAAMKSSPGNSVGYQGMVLA